MLSAPDLLSAPYLPGSPLQLPPQDLYHSNQLDFQPPTCRGPLCNRYHDDLCRQIVGTGAAIHFVAEATIVHDEHASLEQVPRLTQRVYWADLLTYTRKYHGRVAAWLLAALLIPTRAAMAAKRGLYARSAAPNAQQLRTGNR